MAKQSGMTVKAGAAGNLQAVEDNLRQVIQKNPKNINALSQLASLYAQRNDLVSALPLLQRAAQLAPSSLRFNELGVAYHKVGRPDLALAVLEKAVALDRNNGAALFNYGGQLKIVGETERAFELFRLAAEKDERLKIPAIAACATLKEELGQVDEAFADIMTLIEQGHKDPALLSSLGRILHQHAKFSEHLDWAIALLVAALEQQSVRPHEANSYYFLLGTLYQKKKKYDLAFRAFEQGHRLSNYRYDEAFELGVLDQIISSWSMADPKKLAVNSPAKQALFFVVGMPRSGSTLVEQILSVHPESTSLGESDYFSKVLGSYFEREPGHAATYGSCPLAAEEAAAMRSLFMQRAFQTRRPTQIVTDKTLTNTMHVGQILQVFPHAKILWTRRDPRDACLSCYTFDFSGSLAYRHDLRSLARYHNKTEALMHFWQERYPASVYAVDYEELIRNPEAKIRELIAFCDLPWSDDYLRFHQVKRTVTSASYNQVTQPIYSSAIGRWKNYEKHLGPLLAELELPQNE